MKRFVILLVSLIALLLPSMVTSAQPFTAHTQLADQRNIRIFCSKGIKSRRIAIVQGEIPGQGLAGKLRSTPVKITGSPGRPMIGVGQAIGAIT